MAKRKWLLGSTALSGTVGGVFLAVTAAYAGSSVDTSQAPAVDGFNSKFSAFGGDYDNGKSIYGGSGSLSIPLAYQYGAQFDVSLTSLNERLATAFSGHVFWRDPARALFGLYGDTSMFQTAGGIRVSHVAGEGALYLGRWTIEGITGVEFGNSAATTTNGLYYNYNIPTRFFDEVNLAYYLNDNLKLYTGQRYLLGKEMAALGAEYGVPFGKGTMVSLFAEGQAGESGTSAVWGGVRFYFGQKDKTLIRRHREDDPVTWTIYNPAGSAGLGATGTPPSENGLTD